VTKTYDVVNGHPVPDLTHLDREAAIARKAEVQAELGEINRSGVWLQNLSVEQRRWRLKHENEALAQHLRELKEKQKQENLRRNFAGLHSPLWAAVQEILPASTCIALESAALQKLVEREQKKVDQKNG
jgi:hypothetical protein